MLLEYWIQRRNRRVRSVAESCKEKAVDKPSLGFNSLLSAAIFAQLLVRGSTVRTRKRRSGAVRQVMDGQQL